MSNHLQTKNGLMKNVPEKAQIKEIGK